MPKLWLVALNEYSRHVLKRSFILTILGLPILVAGMLLLIRITVNMENDHRPLGYVDHAGLLADPVPAPGDPQKSVPLVAFQTEEEAREALDAGDIQAYYILAADYLATREVELVHIGSPGENATRQFHDFLQINLMADQPPEIALRVSTLSSKDLIVRSLDGKREFRSVPTLGQFSPLLVGFLFMFLILSGGGYLMQAVAQEKENRTMEVLVTSVSPGQLMGGKILGIVAINLTQIVGWTVCVVLGVFIGRNILGIEYLQNLDLNPNIILMVAVLIPAYVLFAALMISVGATAAEPQEAQQMSGLFALPFWIPLWLIVPLVGNPHGPLAMGLTFFPLTAPMAVALRMMITVIPAWQIAASVAILVVCAGGAVWLAGRALRLGMLRYGQRLRLGEILCRAKLQPLAGGSHE